MKTARHLRLVATAIALQQMHGHEYARYFLEEQGFSNSDSREITSWANDTLPRLPNPQFASEFRRALIKLLFSAVSPPTSKTPSTPSTKKEYSLNT
jgi:hypothetical protein